MLAHEDSAGIVGQSSALRSAIRGDHLKPSSTESSFPNARNKQDPERGLVCCYRALGPLYLVATRALHPIHTFEHWLIHILDTNPIRVPNGRMAGVTFQYFTYFLNPLDTKAIFPDNRDKNDILRQVLKETKSISYESRKTRHVFVPVSNKDNFFIAKLGKKAAIRRNLPPEEEFKETFEENWPHCTLIINTNPDNGRGQKIAFEYKNYIFTSPYEQLKHLVDEINTHLFSFGYALSVNPVTEEQEFWKFVSENKDKIEKLTFSFNTPNLFELKNSLNRDLKDLQATYAATKVTLEIENPDGKLKIPKNQLTEEGADYISKGGGEYSVKLKGRYTKTLKSKDKTKTKTFEDLELIIKSDGQETLFKVLDRIFE